MITLGLVISLDPAFAAQVDRLLTVLESGTESIDSTKLAAATAAATAKTAAIDDAVKSNAP